MFEILKIFLETLIKVIPLHKLEELKKKKKLSKIGGDIFLAYCSLNEIYVVGLQIIEEIERSIEWMEKKRREGDLHREYISNLPRLLWAQRANIIKFVCSLQRLRYELEIVASPSLRKLTPFLYGKTNYINSLLNTLGRNTDAAIVSFDPSELVRKTKLAEPAADAWDPYWQPFQMRGALWYWPNGPEKEHIENLNFISIEHLKYLKKYIKQRNPREQIEYLHKILDNIYESIKEHFDLKDILLNVGDWRIRSENRFPFMM